MDAEAAARPRFKSSLEPVVDADDGLFLLHEQGHEWLPGPLWAQLAPLLDGRHTVEQVFDTLADHHDPAAVLHALDLLRARGHLALDAGLRDRPRDAWWAQADVAPRATQRRLARQRVELRVLPPAQPQSHAARALDSLADVMLVQLQAGGLRRAARVLPDAAPSRGGLSVLLVDDALNPALAGWNARALAAGHAWLMVKPVGRQAWIGPLFEPPHGACWACLAHRLQWHRRVHRHLGRDALAAQPLQPAWAAATVAEAAALATEWLATGRARALAGAVLTREGPGAATQRHPLQRRPQCTACGNPTAAVAATPFEAAPLLLQPRPLAPGRADGGHRSGHLDDTLRRLEAHLSPITGLVASVSGGERVARPGEDTSAVAVAAADHNFADVAERRFFVQEGLRRRSGGKGRSAAQARAGALAEALERYCGVADGTERRFTASLQALERQGDTAVHPNAVMGYSERQYRQRSRWNRRDHKAFWVPEPFDAAVPVQWCALWSLTHRRTRHLPAALCWFGHPEPQAPVFARADSNGCAAGAVLEDAVLQGLLELIERDAVALWWYARLRRPGVDLDRVRDPYAQQLREHYRALSREVWVLDVTSDLGVPCYAALSRRTDQAREDIIYGFGCHLDADVALSRALTEMNQSLDAVPLAGGPRGTHTHRGSAQSLAWWRRVHRDAEPWLQPQGTARRPAPGRATDIRDEIDTLVQRLARAGLEVMVLDQTRPDVGLPVVRVVAPGLRHFWARFGPGRLYEVPLQQGWLPRRLDESELNPWVIQF